MNRIFPIAILASLLLLGGCASMKQTPAEKARIAAQVNHDLDSKSYVIEVTQMVPSRGAIRYVSDYSLRVDGDNLYSHLPYVGAVSGASFGGGKGLNFEAKIKDYSEKTLKQGRRQISLTSDNGEDLVSYMITVMENGSVTINVHSRQLQQISYHGTILTQ